MPVFIPVIAAVAAVGATAVSAAAVGLFATSTIFAAVAAVGATMGAIGAVTKNKGLSIAGMVIGGIGGLGSLATAAGIIPNIDVMSGTAVGAGSAGAGTAGSAAAEGTPGAAAGQPSLSPFGNAIPDAAQPATYGGYGVGGPMASGDTGIASWAANQAGGDMLPMDMQQPPPPGGYTTASADTTPVPPGTSPSPDTNTQVPSPGQAATTTPNPQQAAANPVPPPASTTPGQVAPVSPAEQTGQFSLAPTVSQGEGVKEVSNGIFSDILKFAKDNQLLTYGALQAGGSLLSGATNQLTPAQINLANAQAAANQAAANLQKQQLANIQAPKATATLNPVSGSAQPLVPPPTAAQPIQNTGVPLPASMTPGLTAAPSQGALPISPGLINNIGTLAPVTGRVA